MGAGEYAGILEPVTVEMREPDAFEMAGGAFERSFRGATDMGGRADKALGAGETPPAAIAPVTNIVASAQALAKAESFVLVCRDMSLSYRV